MYTPYAVANPLTTIRIPRLLRLPGEVLVRTGDSVEPTQIVAQAVVPPDFRIVEFARDLDVLAKNANGYLKVKRGQPISEGDVLAARGGLSDRACLAPISGKVIGVGRGRLLLQAEPQIERLNALIPGYVADVQAGVGAVIEAVGGLIQAAWGNDKEAYGLLRMVVRGPDHPIRATHINASSQGAILVGGSTVEAECIEQAAGMQVRGMIVGSIPASLVPQIREASFPILATEGIGTAPMTRVIFDLLHSLDGREAAVSGDMGRRWHEKRPFIVVPMPTQAARPIDVNVPVAVGQRIRVLRGELRGLSGTVSQLLDGLITLETEARLPGAVVTFDGGEQVEVPYVNLERLL
jgi:hypothetical protein